MAVKLPIFMDANSTTPVDPRVVEAMLPYFTEKFGHPGSRNHPFGWEAEAAMDRGREQVARLIGARDPKELVFTSGGTEADNLALKGVVEMYREKGNHIVTTAVEPRSVLDPCQRLEKQGVAVTYLPVDATGLVDVDAIRGAITDKTILISIMFANNEIGTIQLVAEIGKLAKEKGILFHTDATEAVGKIPVDVEKMGIDLLSCTAHKIYGPKGIGALYVRRRGPRVRIASQIDGGGHERGARSGTVPVALAVAFGKAAELCREVMAEEAARRSPGSPPGPGPLAGRRGVPERSSGAPAPPRPEHLVRLCGGRVRADGPEPGGRALLRLGLHVGDPGAVLRDPGSRGGGRSGALVDPLRAPPLHHRGGGPLRRRPDGRRGPAPS
jgi:cysteine desulfurase